MGLKGSTKAEWPKSNLCPWLYGVEWLECADWILIGKIIFKANFSQFADKKRSGINYQSCIRVIPLKWYTSIRAANNFPAGAGQIVQSTYFCSDISHFWPDKHRLRLIAIKVPPPPFTWCLNMKQVNFQSIYCTWVSISMQEKWNAWYSKICITFVRTTIASVLRLIYG